MHRRVLDTVGSGVEEQSLEVLKLGGLPVATLMPRRATSTGLRPPGDLFAHSSNSKRLADVAARIDEGARLVLDRAFPLREAPDALAYLATGRAKGKAILVALRGALPGSRSARGDDWC